MDPSTIGRFKVLRALGAGAMGTVYLAEDPLLKRPLAIKVVRGCTGDTDLLARFQREAEISARLNHPNAITVFDVGEEPGLGPFLVMEYVDGESLSDWIRSGPLAPDLAVGLLIQAADAVQAMHGLGIVHRDIKPENFMVAKDGRLKLMDFGIARGDGGRLTATSTFLGSPAYAAPEVLNGAKAGPGADRWSFTLTAFEMLTGTLPFGAESVGATLYRIAHEPAVLPLGLDPGLAAVFARAMEKNPSARFPDLRAFLQALIEALPLDSDRRAAHLAQLVSTVPVKGTGIMRMEPPAGARSQRRRWLGAVAAVLAATGLWFVFLRPTSFAVPVTTEPPGAEIFLDGASKGLTPATVQVPREGSHQLRLTLDGHQPWNAALERHRPLPDPIRLQKVRPKKAGPGDGKIKKFFKGMFQP